MRVLAGIRRTADWSKEMIRATLQNMLEKWDEAERRLRRKMRIYPPLAPASLGARFPNHPLLRRRLQTEPDAEERRWQDARENAIISVNGKDLSSEDEIADAEPPREQRKNERRKKAA